MTLAGIKPASFWTVVQSLNQLHHTCWGRTDVHQLIHEDEWLTSCTSCFMPTKYENAHFGEEAISCPCYKLNPISSSTYSSHIEYIILTPCGVMQLCGLVTIYETTWCHTLQDSHLNNGQFYINFFVKISNSLPVHSSHVTTNKSHRTSICL